ncbi:MAG TPA: MXAN_2562 family outer membrane beta-barrel protein [Myxococcales bacterium]|nr:MXAN_2562 family outer membrane beta-barrel protein [Myxococcales bacterium]
MARLALVAALLAPASALAQQITITSSFAKTFLNGGAPSVNIGKSLCIPSQAIDFTYDLGVVPTPGVDTVEAWIIQGSGNCSTTPGSPPAPSQQLSVPNQSSQTGTLLLHLRVGELLFPDSVFSGGCANTTSRASSPFNEFFCVRRVTTAVFGGNPTVNSNTLQVSFALNPPNAPSSPVATPGDSHVVLDWTSNDSGDQVYDVFVVPHGTDPSTIDLTRFAAHNVTGTRADVDHDSSGASLQNGVIYDVYVRSIDGYQNASALSGATPIEPVLIADFYSRYRQAGGTATGGGGCATGGQAGVLAFAVLAFAAARRRRKTAAAALLLAIAPAARADWTGLDRPPARWLLGFKIDRYDPQIDTEASLVTAGKQPYHDIFHGRAPPRFQIELDYQVLHPFGSVLVGGTVGFWQNTGHGIYATDYTDPATGVVHKAGEQSGDTARLMVVPFGAVVSYRLDWFANRYRWLPVIPYAQAGLQAALWTSYNGTGDVSQPSSGGRGSGWSYGYTAALGLALDVGSVDAELAREAYVDMGIQRTAIFAEYAWTRLSDFGKSGTLILSDRAWRFGISVEF